MARKSGQEVIFESELKEQRVALEMEFKKKLAALKAKSSEMVRKVDNARTHVVMNTTPYIMKALGLSEILNITAEQVDADEVLRKRVKESGDFSVVFEEYESAAKAVGDYLFHNPDVKEMIMEYVNKELEHNGKQAIRASIEDREE